MTDATDARITAAVDQADARNLAEGRTLNMGNGNRLPATAATLARAREAGDTELAARITAALAKQPRPPAATR